MNRSRNFPAALAATALLACSPYAAADPASVRVPAGDAVLEIAIPGHIVVGQSPVLSITVTSSDGAPAPTAIRTRLGMPAHGHWITTEAEQPAAGTRRHRFRAMNCEKPADSSGENHTTLGAHGATTTMSGHGSAAKMAAAGHGSSGTAHVVTNPGGLCLDHGFEALYPMAGTYRLRIWLDYEDGRTVRSGVDMDVGHGIPLSLRPAP